MNSKTYFQKINAKILRAWGKHDNTYQKNFTIQTSQIALLGNLLVSNLHCRFGKAFI
jgi:hypothetical protein